MEHYLKDPVDAVNYINRTLEMMGITTIGTFPSEDESHQAQTLCSILELLDMRNRDQTLKSDISETMVKLEYDKNAALQK